MRDRIERLGEWARIIADALWNVVGALFMVLATVVLCAMLVGGVVLVLDILIDRRKRSAFSRPRRSTRLSARPLSDTRRRISTTSTARLTRKSSHQLSPLVTG